MLARIDKVDRKREYQQDSKTIQEVINLLTATVKINLLKRHPNPKNRLLNNRF